MDSAPVLPVQSTPVLSTFADTRYNRGVRRNSANKNNTLNLDVVPPNHLSDLQLTSNDNLQGNSVNLVSNINNQSFNNSNNNTPINHNNNLEAIYSDVRKSVDDLRNSNDMVRGGAVTIGKILNNNNNNNNNRNITSNNKKNAYNDSHVITNTDFTNSYSNNKKCDIFQKDCNNFSCFNNPKNINKCQQNVLNRAFYNQKCEECCKQTSLDATNSIEINNNDIYNTCCFENLKATTNRKRNNSTDELNSLCNEDKSCNNFEVDMSKSTYNRNITRENKIINKPSFNKCNKVDPKHTSFTVLINTTSTIMASQPMTKSPKNLSQKYAFSSSFMPQHSKAPMFSPQNPSHKNKSQECCCDIDVKDCKICKICSMERLN